MKHILLTLALLGLSNLCMAQATGETPLPSYDNPNAYGLITKLSVQEGIAYLKTSQAADALARPVCATHNNWDYAFEIDSNAGKAIYSLALAAFEDALGVVIIPSGQCLIHASIEDTWRISLGSSSSDHSID